MDGYCRNCDCFYIISDRSSDDVDKDGKEEYLCPVCWDVLVSDITDNHPLDT